MARCRLLCFPWAGGSAASYQGWSRFLPEDVELWLVTPAGREPRHDEPEAERADAYVAAVTAAVLERPAMPLTLFGHSFGGLMAYETALRLTAATRIPTRLIVSACPVPGRLSIDADTDRLPDPQLVALIRERFGGLPAGLEESPEFLALVLHRIRADLRLMQQCSAGPRPLLPVPISVFWSPEDRSVTEHVVSPWAARSTHGATFHTFEGGHFFVSAQADAVTACIASLLRDDLDVSPRRAAVTR